MAGWARARGGARARWWHVAVCAALGCAFPLALGTGEGDTGGGGSRPPAPRSRPLCQACQAVVQEVWRMTGAAAGVDDDGGEGEVILGGAWVRDVEGVCASPGFTRTYSDDVVRGCSQVVAEFGGRVVDAFLGHEAEASLAFWAADAVCVSAAGVCRAAPTYVPVVHAHKKECSECELVVRDMEESWEARRDRSRGALESFLNGYCGDMHLKYGTWRPLRDYCVKLLRDKRYHVVDALMTQRHGSGDGQSRTDVVCGGGKDGRSGLAGACEGLHQRTWDYDAADPEDVVEDKARQYRPTNGFHRSADL